jgi:hypothetical protein
MIQLQRRMKSNIQLHTIVSAEGSQVMRQTTLLQIFILRSKLDQTYHCCLIAKEELPCL